MTAAGSAARHVVVRPEPDLVADLVANRLLDRLAEVEADGREPHVVLTGGSLTRRLHARVADLATGRDDINWSRVNLWWGDERYVPDHDDERNAAQAWRDCLHTLPLDPARVHAMPASNHGFADVGAAAAAYATTLRASRASRSPEPDAHPWFDVLMLGIGPDGHCASLFPDRPEVQADGLVLPVTDAPKPPPTRISLSMEVLRRAHDVWFVAAGEEKAAAVARSVAGDDVVQTPAAGPRGIHRTVWYLDEAAAAQVRS